MSCIKTRLCSVAFALICGLGLITDSQAALVNYGDFVGDTVNFKMVTESTNGALPPGGNFGSPTVSGDALDFAATGFSVEVSNGVEFLDGKLRMMIEAKDGHVIDSVFLGEFGAYFDFGASALSFVEAVAFVQVDGALYEGTFARTFTDDNGVLPPTSGGWSDSLTINFPAATKVTLTLDNRLFAAAGENEFAQIDKKGVRIEIDTTPVPEPTTIAMFGIVAVGLVTRRRR